MSKQMKTRAQLSPEESWNIQALYSSLEDWEKAFQNVREKPTPPYWPNLNRYRGRLKEGEEMIKETLNLSFKISRTLDKLHTYAHNRHNEEITEDRFKKAYQQISSLLLDFQEESAWIEPEILMLPLPLIQSYLDKPELTIYRFYLEKILRMRPYRLDADREKLIAIACKPMQTSSKTFSALNDADMKIGTIIDSQGQEHPLTQGTYQVYMRSQDPILRQNAFKRMHSTLQEFENTFSELLYGQVQSHLFNARARSYTSCLDAALFPKNIPTSIYYSLIKAVRERIQTLHRYVHLRKNVLKLREIHLYDMYVPLVSHIDFKMSYTEAEDLTLESVIPLGKEYQNILKQGLKKDRWVDPYENKHKRSGAYSNGCFDSFPYILMNFHGILRDTFTLAHEAGHSMHSYLSRTHQPYHYSDYSIFVAEVASTFNEELLMALLLKRSTKKEEKLFLLNEKIEDIRATFFRQTMFAEFELKIHELVENNIPLTPSLLKTIYYQLNVDYFGPDAFIDEEIQIEWARIPHFYYNFYVYQYATGISAALTLAEKVLSGDAKARDHYLQFLKGGSSLFPIELLKLAGVDMISTEPIEGIFHKFNSLLDQFELIACEKC
ncbi:MAG: oligoendopeptidase F [Chlamydiales bacterium]